MTKCTFLFELQCIYVRLFLEIKSTLKSWYWNCCLIARKMVANISCIFHAQPRIHWFLKKIQNNLQGEPCLIVPLCSFWAPSLSSMGFWHCLKALPQTILSDLKVTSAFTLFPLCVQEFDSQRPFLLSVWLVQYLKQRFTAYFDLFSYPEG